ncbi:protein FAM171A2 [Esox lucius]|uniref:Family with sequence similarity 171 member A2a n=1 Tax=Esox lucius TaxID=8010 RepID=A0A3P8ZYP3_ESOLU|nr:protein FAM171A2 [Esox lucius]
MPTSKATWMNGHLSGICNVAVRMPPPHIFRPLLVVFLGSLWDGLAKSIADQGALEVLIRVQVFDNSDLSPIAEAGVDVFGNQSALASSKAGEDGIVTVTFLYRPGTWVIVTATKNGFVTNSAPWHASRVPLYASVSLYLLPQRPATLILYDDVVQVLLGTPGGKNQPWMQLQRRSMSLALNSTKPELSAALTYAQSQYEMGGFPYPLGWEGNATGVNSSWVELTAVAAVSAHLYGQNGTSVQAWEPIHMSIPLPVDTPLQTATSVPMWRFDDKTGLWVRKGTGYIKKNGTQLTWSFVASQLGYWLAAFPSTTGSALNPSGLRDISIYHTFFLLAILGSMALLVLVLLCLLLYYCRRRCLKPRQQQHRHGKTLVSAGLDGSRRDQCTSTSQLNLISSGHILVDTASSTGGDPDALKSDLSSSRDIHSSREDFFRHAAPGKAQRQSRLNVDAVARCSGAGGESFPMKATTRSTNTNDQEPPRLARDDTRSFSSVEENTHDPGRRHNHHTRNAGDSQGYSSDPPSPPPLLPPFTGHYQDYCGLPPEYSASQTGDLLARPNSLNTQPGQLIFCHSMDQMKESVYRSVVPTLVIPAHYMRLSSDLSAVEQALERQQQMQHDVEGIQVSMTLPRQQNQQNRQQNQQNQQQQNHQQHRQGDEESDQRGEESEHSKWASDPNAAPMRIPVLFNDNTISQMNGELQALTEKKLLELGVKPHPRAWFVSLDGRSNSLVRHSYIELGGDPLSVPGGGAGAVGSHHDNRVDVAREANIKQRRGKEERKAREAAAMAERKDHAGKTYTKLPCIDPADPPSGESFTAAHSPEDNSMAPLLDEAPETIVRGGTFPRKGRSQDNSARSSSTNTSEATRRDSATSPEDGEDADDKDEEGNRKSPWQKREERPLMVWK